jgi:hypothetical protein
MIRSNAQLFRLVLLLVLLVALAAVCAGWGWEGATDDPSLDSLMF